MRASRALITGGAGQLAQDLRDALAGSHEVSCLGHAELDITHHTAVASALVDLKPAVVFNCAAFHNVERCETDEEAAAAVNVRAVKRLAEACDDNGAKLVHFSTNYVFDGTSSQPYREDDLPNPQSIYAITKLAGEHAARSYAGNALVVRTAGLYGLAGSDSKGGNFVQRMAARAAKGSAIEMVADQRLTPTFTADLARATIDAVDAGTSGTIHLTNDGSCSWYEFTTAIVERCDLDAEVVPVKTVRKPGGARRPLNGVLARPATDSFGLNALRPWEEALADYVDRARLRQLRA